MITPLIALIGLVLIVVVCGGTAFSIGYGAVDPSQGGLCGRSKAYHIEVGDEVYHCDNYTWRGDGSLVLVRCCECGVPSAGNIVLQRVRPQDVRVSYNAQE